MYKKTGPRRYKTRIKRRQNTRQDKAGLNQAKNNLRKNKVFIKNRSTDK